MTKKILLALALTLGTATLDAPTASACGGYMPESPDVQAVRVRVAELAARQRAWTGPSVWNVRVEGDRATATFSVTRGAQVEIHQVFLRRRGARWNVLRIA